MGERTGEEHTSDDRLDPASRVDRRTRVRVGVGAAIVLVLAALGTAVVVALLAPGGATAIVPPSRGERSAVPSPIPSSALYIHLLGAVARPGLYRLPAGSRVVDAVAAGGGLTADADRGSVNLAREVADGEQIVVAVQGAPAAPGAPAGSASGSAAGSAASAGVRVNLNTADATALETLPRVGPAMAQRIIDWRTKNGRFTAVEDLLDVSGIGDATFAGLKDLVTV